mmetsp:Transcript_1673/g.5382  ORF Transcript_1673/g.5382 Transcript_1673/m.5382 type:complete len:234 (-) Transcript_1673:5770-6471(-)
MHPSRLVKVQNPSYHCYEIGQQKRCETLPRGLARGPPSAVGPNVVVHPLLLPLPDFPMALPLPGAPLPRRVLSRRSFSLPSLRGVDSTSGRARQTTPPSVPSFAPPPSTAPPPLPLPFSSCHTPLLSFAKMVRSSACFPATTARQAFALRPDRRVWCPPAPPSPRPSSGRTTWSSSLLQTELLSRATTVAPLRPTCTALLAVTGTCSPSTGTAISLTVAPAYLAHSNTFLSCT